MYWRRSGYYVEPGDLFGSIVVFLVIFILLCVLFFYVYIILLWILLGIAGGLAFCYALFIYIKNIVASARTLGGYTGRNTFTTVTLRWFELYKNASTGAFMENISIAGNALTRAHGYRLISPKKWFWLFVAPAVLICGTALIIAVILLQGVVLVGAVFAAIGLVIALCVLMFFVAFCYALVATGKNMPAATSRGGNIFTSFEYHLSTRFPDFFSGMGKYFVTLGSYIAGIWSENLQLGLSNGRMASGYRVFSVQRYFLYLSLAALILAACIWIVLMTLFFIILFPFMTLAAFFWTLIATILHK